MVQLMVHRMEKMKVKMTASAICFCSLFSSFSFSLDSEVGRFEATGTLEPDSTLLGSLAEPRRERGRRAAQAG